jgi:hypothetical protein
MDATGGSGGESTGEPQVGRMWLLKIALMFGLALLAGVGLGMGLGVIPVGL